MANSPERNLWAEVLLQVMNDALKGASTDKAHRRNDTEAARRYLTSASKDCNLVCHFAGIDPEAFRSRMRKLIADAPSVEELCEQAKTEPRVSRTKLFAFNGEERSICSWAKIVGLSEPTLRQRLQKGWSIEKALTTPPRGRQTQPRPTSQSFQAQTTGSHSAARPTTNINSPTEEVNA